MESGSRKTWGEGDVADLSGLKSLARGESRSAVVYLPSVQIWYI